MKNYQQLNHVPSQLLTHPIGGRNFWSLDPQVTFLNHGSFGSCPRPVLKYQCALQDRLERQPVRFLVDDFEALWDDARRTLAQFVGADRDDLVFVPNATTGVNTILRSLELKRGDEVLTTDHAYNACRCALDFVAVRAGARVVVAKVPFPLESSQQVVDAVLERVTRKTRLALLDHVTSSTGLVLPLEKIVSELSARGIETLVDGAHAPGMIPLNLKKLGATYYTGNCHKWLCAPKGAALLYVQRDRQAQIRPLVISHGANSPRDYSRFLLEFSWTGTGDFSAWLSVPESLRQIGALLPGGWPMVMQRNRALALAARDLLCETLKISPPCPDDMIGTLAAVPLPDMSTTDIAGISNGLDPLRGKLLREHNIEVPVFPWPAPPKRWLRVSAQLYNSLPQYEKLAAVLKKNFPARKLK
ncbi:MAG: aminotransferase class V-fold PLP-dependent enzyme [Limisphaerales bacterium]